MPEPSKEEIKNIQEESGELVKRALIQVGDLQDVEEKLKGIVERSSKITPPPEKPGRLMTRKFVLLTRPRWVGFKLTEEGENGAREFESIPQAFDYARTLPDAQGSLFVVFDDQGKEMACLTV
ncbi:MAG TPA: hypothetical protein VGM54_26010 [Chthoniobacter sp.]|jgi:hypothetical protein